MKHNTPCLMMRPVCTIGSYMEDGAAMFLTEILMIRNYFR